MTCKICQKYCDHDVYLACNCNTLAIGFNAKVGHEIQNTLERIEDDTYEYVGVKPIVKSSYFQEIHDGW